MSLRLVVFHGKGDALLVQASGPRAVALPPLVAPFTAAGVAESCRVAGVDATVITSSPRPWTQGLRDARNAERGAVGAREGAQHALHAQVLKGSVDPYERDRSALVERLHTMDAERFALKTKLAQMGSVAVNAAERRERSRWLARVAELNQESAAVQAVLTKMKTDHQRATQSTFERRFIETARATLPPETFADLVAAVNEGAEDEAPSAVAPEHQRTEYRRAV